MLARSCIFGLTALLLSACAFEKTVVNEGVKDLDPSSLVAGQSTILDVIEEVGIPLPNFPEEIGTRLVSRNYLNYAVYEQRCFRIGFENFFLITPFRWCFGDNPYEFGVAVDDAGVVTGVYETRREMIWPPFQDEAKRPPPETTVLSEVAK